MPGQQASTIENAYLDRLAEKIKDKVRGDTVNGYTVFSPRKTGTGKDATFAMRVKDERSGKMMYVKIGWE